MSHTHIYIHIIYTHTHTSIYIMYQTVHLYYMFLHAVFTIIYPSNCIILGIYMSQKRPCPEVQGAFAVKATTDDDGDALADAHARYSASMWQGDADFHRRRALEGHLMPLGDGKKYIKS